MAKSNELGMQTFDQALYQSYASGEIGYETALAHADSPNDLRLMIKLGAATAKTPGEQSQGLALEDDDQSAIFSFRRNS
jgi:twitching motility protein PilU